MVTILLIERSECDDDVQSMMMILLFRSSKYDDDVADLKVKVLKMLLLIKR